MKANEFGLCPVGLSGGTGAEYDFPPKILTRIKTAHPPCFQPLDQEGDESCLVDGDNRYPVMSLEGDKFVDYGLTVIDCTSKPIRIVCAGTGGVGTIASVSILNDTLSVSDALAETGRAVLVVQGSSPSNPGSHYSPSDAKEAKNFEIESSYAF